MHNGTQNLYSKLPQLGELLADPQVGSCVESGSHTLVVSLLRELLSELRGEIAAGQHDGSSLDARISDLPLRLQAKLAQQLEPSLRRVINATGVLLQTNMGRAPLSAAALQHVVEVAGGYCNLELDVTTGERSRRDQHAEDLLLHVLSERLGRTTSAMQETHGACVVNNCAAAALLALNTLAEGGEVIVSRGELVEIGGGFRVPDILCKSGALLREVGTTNKTRARDYEDAITPATRLILRVHPSNFRMEGFTERPSLEDVITAAGRHGVPVFEDQGTGCVVDLHDFGIAAESSWIASVGSGVALVAASGDKLLGGPQCGLLVGHKQLIEKLRCNPLFRAMRADKLTYAALESTLLTYLRGDEHTLPLVAMMRTPVEEIRARCDTWAETLRLDRVDVEVRPTESVIGGGTTPAATLPSFAVVLRARLGSEAELAELLRAQQPPIIARVKERAVWLDLRTIAPADDGMLLGVLQRALSREGHR